MEVSNKNDGYHLFRHLESVKENRGSGRLNTCHIHSRQRQDSVVLSAQAKEVLEASRQARRVADVRTEKVAELKQQMDHGTYRFDGQKIAFKMIRESVLNQIG